MPNFQKLTANQKFVRDCAVAFMAADLTTEDGSNEFSHKSAKSAVARAHDLFLELDNFFETIDLED